MGSCIMVVKNQKQARRQFYKSHGKRWVITKIYPIVSRNLAVRVKPKRGKNQTYRIRYRMNKRRK